MSVFSARRRLTAAAVLATSLSVAACQSGAAKPQSLPSSAGSSSAAPTAPTAPASSPAPATTYLPGMGLVSDGTDTVQFAGRAVKFPTTVTEAAFSGDGSRIAFVDADGNVDVARPDGSSRIVLTKKNPKDKRSHPAWDSGGRVMWSETSPDGGVRLQATGVPADAATVADQTLVDYTRGGDSGTGVGNTAPNATGDFLAYQHKGAKGPEVWIVDRYERSGDYASKAVDGAEPAMSPDGKKVAFVAANGEIAVEDLAWRKAPTGTAPAKPVQISAGAKSPTHLTWTPDGKAVAFSTAQDVEAVEVGTKPAAPHQLSAKPGVLTYLPMATDKIEHITGKDLIAQAIAASQSRWGTQKTTAAPAGGGGHWPTATSITLVSSDDPSLAMVGVKRARTYMGPMLFTPKGSLDPRTADEIKRALGTVPAEAKVPGSTLGTVFIVGGTDFVSADTEAAVVKLGYQVQRITGADQASTLIAAEGLEPFSADSAEDVVLVSQDDPAALAEAMSSTEIVLLTNGSAIPEADKPILKSLNSKGHIHTLGKGAAAAAASSWAGKPAGVPVAAIDASVTIPGVYAAVVVPTGSVPDAIVGALMAAYFEQADLVFVDSAAGIDPASAKVLDALSAQINTVAVVDSRSTLTDIGKKAGALTAGPLGPDDVTDPMAPAAKN